MADHKRIPRDHAGGRMIEGGMTPADIIEAALRTREGWLMRSEALEYHTLAEQANILIMFSVSEIRKLIDALPANSNDQVIIWLRSHLEQHIEGFGDHEAEYSRDPG